MPSNPCLDAALGYAGRGWPVLPCSPEHKRPLLAAQKDPATGKSIRGTGGLSSASCDADLIADWWRRWPKAMVAVATGHGRCFVLDFDPRVDDATGEVFELASLKAALEAQMGCELPQSLTSITQSGGVHVWLIWPDDGGEPVRNRGNLPEHVDVRGAGGYVIMPPSVMATGAAYRWMKGRGPGEIAIAEAPAALVRILRDRGKNAAVAPSSGLSRPQADAASAADLAEQRRHALAGLDAVETARRRYALAALDAECQRIETAASGQRNQQLNSSAYAVAQLVGAGVLGASMARAAIEASALRNPGRDDRAQIDATIDSGWSAGLAQPKDMTGIGERAGKPPRLTGASRRPSPAPGPRAGGDEATLPKRNDRREPSAQRGGAEQDRDAATVVRLMSMGERWLQRQAVPVTADEAGRLAYRAGQRWAAGVIPPLSAAVLLWGLVGIDGTTEAKAREDFDAGAARGFDTGRWECDLACAQLPMTDMGNAERFVRRHGQDFRFTTAKGWLGWDGRRWAVLDQEEDSTPAAVMAAVFATVRAIQDEARAVEATGAKGWTPHGLDFVWKATKTSVTMFSDALGAHGRASESSGRLGCIANLAKRWLTVTIEEFDADPFAINMNNGTLLLRREKIDGQWRAHAELVPHDRSMLISKLAPVDYDPHAAAELYDAMMEWAQPDAAVRRYLHQWGGYSASGHVGAQILHFWYGRGANGKSTAIDAWAGALGDYSGTIQIETFLDQGIKKRGDAATPDLARLGGVRLLRASEPERGAKLNEALIKAATGGEPMAVRALHRGFFDLRPAFKLTIGGNYKPDVPGTDEGIWRRIKLVPWNSFLAEGQRDEDLPTKLRAEYPGIMARLVLGLLDWMENGFIEPEAVTEATAEYRSDSDPLARFLNMCVEHVEGERVQASRLHSVFLAWCKAAGEREWSAKGLAGAMKTKGFANKQSNGMHWLGIRLVKDVHDFIDADGKVRDLAEAEPFTPRQPDDPGPPPEPTDRWIADDDYGDPEWRRDPFADDP